MNYVLPSYLISVLLVLLLSLLVSQSLGKVKTALTPLVSVHLRITYYQIIIHLSGHKDVAGRISRKEEESFI